MIPLIQGQSNVGSFALAQVKSTLTGAAVEAMLANILESVERDVIRHLYELNNFDVSRMGRLDYEGLTDIDLESYSKAVPAVTHATAIVSIAPPFAAVTMPVDAVVNDIGKAIPSHVTYAAIESWLAT